MQILDSQYSRLGLLCALVCQNNLEDFQTYTSFDKFTEKLGANFPFEICKHDIFRLLPDIDQNDPQISQINDISSLAAYLKREEFVRYLLFSAIQLNNGNLLKKYLSNPFMEQYINILNEVEVFLSFFI